MINVNPFYLTTKWKTKREQVLKRDNYLCQECLRYGKHTKAVTVHHIKHLDEFPELAYDSKNLISLCYACHNKAHKEKGTKSQHKQRGSYYKPYDV